MTAHRRPRMFTRMTNIAATTAATLVVLAAATVDVAAQQQPRPVDCRFLCLAGTPQPPPMVNPAGEQIEVEVSVPVQVLSPVVRCFAVDGTIRFLTADDRQPVATARIPAGIKSAVLVFLPASASPAQAPAPAPAWRVMVIDDSPAKFPDGGAFAANLCSGEVRFVLGEHKILLPAGRSHGFKRPTKRDQFNMAPLIVQFRDAETWRTASESSLRFVPGNRFLILAYVDPGSARPRVATFPDIRPAMDPEDS